MCNAQSSICKDDLGRYNVSRICSGFGKTDQPENWQPIHAAACVGNVEYLRNLIHRNADIDVRDGFGRIPMHIAASLGRTPAVEMLVYSGADINATDDNGWTPLMHAAWERHPSTVISLINSGADITLLGNHGVSVLMAAASVGDAVSVTALIHKNCQINLKQAETGMTALLYAASSGNPEVTRLLLLAGADPQDVNCDGRNPFMMAIGIGDLTTAKLLLNRVENINNLDYHGKSALIIAAEHGYADIVTFLLVNGANKNIKASCSKDNKVMEDVYLISMDAGAWAEMNGHLDVVSILEQW